MGSISLGCSLVAGNILVPSPAIGRTAFRSPILFPVMLIQSTGEKSTKIGLSLYFS
jgi:hypothetical protein